VLGNSDIESLQIHFENIRDEYYDLVGSDGLKKYLAVKAEITLIKDRIDRSSMAFDIYWMNKNSEIKEILNNFGFYFDNSLPYNKCLIQFNGFIEDLKIDIKNISSSLLNEENDEEKKPVTRETFLSNIVEMNKEGFKADMNMMTDVYAITLNKFNALRKKMNGS
jgi:hypothetical protein